MNKRILVILSVCIGFSSSALAQYYYKEILSNKQLIADRNAYKEKKIRTIIVHSLEANGEPSEGFFCEKKISKDYSRIETETQTESTGKSILTTYFDAKGLVSKTIDQSDLLTAVSNYKYDSDNNLISIFAYSYSTQETDTSLYVDSRNDTISLSEEHIYSYNNKGQPTKMLRVKNKTDTTVFNFTIDEAGNVTDEIEAVPNGRHYYYYYSENNRLTDIVKYSVIKRKLLPDFMFEYDTDGQLLQMITTEEEVANNYSVQNNYFIWKYFYGDDGFRIIEKCFSNEKKLLGSFEYEYK
ncbi:hypothetical protein ACQ33O_13570 [Ferruginibacter sp. SUN002]|uniref:hypothetical protein n=1 Tax=Ferruginibacter sp. SUN002 TaxID=2937789 RepID=UPI003D362191